MPASAGATEIDERFLGSPLVEREIHLECVARSSLQTQSFVERDNALPLVHSAAGHPDSARHGNRRIIEMGENGVLQHAVEGTAC